MSRPLGPIQALLLGQGNSLLPVTIIPEYKKDRLHGGEPVGHLTSLEVGSRGAHS